MVNEEKVKIMNRLAMYEHGEGRKYLPVSRYYRSDYIGLALIRNFFLVTIGYVLGLTYIQYSVKYFRAKKSVREYYQDLTRLEKIYGREEKRNPVRRNAGGHRK